MDMQGTPIGSSEQGMKNTSDPERYENPINEGPGPIASDSLAAESARAGGAFSENKVREPLGVKGASSTFANTDISGTTILPPAPDVDARQAQGDWEESSRLKGAAGIKYSAEFGYVGGPTAAKAEMQQEGTSTYQTSFGEGGGRSVSADPAPAYVAPVVGQTQSKPKGKNIQEGGFDSDAPNASFTTEIGSKKDPGQLAENKFQREMAESGADAGVPRQKGLEDKGQGFGVLGSDESALDPAGWNRYGCAI